jgi:predicted N-acetyltransferase YhbS
MVLDDLSISMPVNEEVSIVRVTLEEACEHAESTRYIFLSVKNSDIYRVYPKEGQDSIVFSVLTHVSPDIVLLGGSSVSEGWRSKRVYKTLVQKRLSDAREAGVTKAFVQAVEETSAP